MGKASAQHLADTYRREQHHGVARRAPHDHRQIGHHGIGTHDAQR